MEDRAIEWALFSEALEKVGGSVEITFDRVKKNLDNEISFSVDEGAQLVRARLSTPSRRKIPEPAGEMELEPLPEEV